MRWVIVAACLAAVAAVAIATGGLGLRDEGSNATVRLPHVHLGPIFGESGVVDRGISGDSCERLSEMAALISVETADPRRFLRRLGREAAGIHEGPRGFVDLARGGSDTIPGRGFRRRYDDGTDGQARHFAGIAVAASYGGEQATRLISIFARRDPLSSADGQLTEQALAFSRLLLGRGLRTDQSGEWILDRICRSSV